MKLLVRVIIFQSLWFLFAYWGNLSYQYLVPIIALISVILDWKLSKSVISFKNLSLFLVFLLLSGLIVDGSLFGLKLIVKDDHSGFLSPMNMWGFWIIFAPYYEFAFEKFNKSKWMGVVFAAIGAPMAYRGGAALAGFSITQNGYIVMAILWMIFFPISLWLYYSKLQN